MLTGARHEGTTLGARIIHCDVGSNERPDLATVDALARLQLAAHRCGCRVELVGTGEPLCDLLRLVGLAASFGIDESGVEARGQAEQREEPGRVEEERDPGDLPA